MNLPSPNLLWLLALWVSGGLLGIAIHRVWVSLFRPRFGPYWVCFANGEDRKEVLTADEAIALQEPGQIIMVSVSAAYIDFKERTQSKYRRGPAAGGESLPNRVSEFAL